MKKKIIFVCIALIFGVTLPMSAMQETDAITEIQQNVVFRSTQKLTANDGWQIYFYSNGTCEWYNENGRKMLTCRYRLSGGEVRLLDENGDTVYKGSYTLSRDRINLNSVSFAGNTYYRR